MVIDIFGHDKEFMSRRLKVFTVGLTGHRQNLAIECGVDPTKPIRQYQLTPDGHNQLPCYEGDEKLTFDHWGTYLPAGELGIPPPPYISPEDGDLYLSDVFVIGRPKDKLHVKVLFNDKHGDE